MRNILTLIKENKKSIIWIAATLTLFILIFLGINALKSCNSKTDKIEYTDSSKVHHVYYEDGSFSNLKKENKDLYDSLKKYKQQINFLVQFNYDKSYNTGKVQVKTKETIKKVPVYIKTENGKYIEYTEEAKTYEYENKPNDTINYKLKINSTREPNWYELNVKMHDKITVVNKDDGNGKNHLTINTNNKADVSDVTVFKKKEKKHIMNVISIGPTVGYGYSLKSHKLEPFIGVSISYNIFGKK